MPRYLAAYDVGDDRTRRRVARVLQAWGTRIQRSVFELDVDPREIAELKARVGELLSGIDEFELVPVDERTPERRSRWQREPSRTIVVRLV